MHLRNRALAAVIGGAALAATATLTVPTSATAGQAAPVAAAETITVTNTDPAAVDGTDLNRSVTVTEDETVADVEVTITAAKSYGGCPVVTGVGNLPAEIYYRLTSPSGTTVRLVRTFDANESDGIGPTYRNRKPDSTYENDFSVQTITFDDEATDPAGPVWGSGTFRPAQPLTAFDGEDTQGDWSLQVGDSVGGQSLCHESFTLDIETPDTTAPTASITTGPDAGATVKTAPTYEFTSDEDGSTFECAVDDGDFTTCTSPYTVDITDLDDGDHSFSVRATDPADNTSGAATRDFTLDAIDTEAPDVAITSGPADGASVTEDPTYGFSTTADDLDHYECKVDAQTFDLCTNPATVQASYGTHTITVRAVDVNDNRSTEVSRTWTLRNLACEDATTVFYDAKADVRTAKDKLAAARESGNPKRIERAKANLATAKDVKNDAKTDAIEECGTKPPPQG